MSNVTYRIRFEPAVNGGAYILPVPDYLFHQKSTAECVVEHFHQTKNPAWNGKFSVVEQADGRPA